MKKITLAVVGIGLFVIIAIALAGMFKFNYLANQPGYDVDGNKAEVVENIDLCDENGNRYSSEQEALDAGLSYAEFGATLCSEYKMHPSWDADNDGINDCENDGSCDDSVDYGQPRK